MAEPGKQLSTVSYQQSAVNSVNSVNFQYQGAGLNQESDRTIAKSAKQLTA